MLRTILLSAFAATTLAGCATGYSYRNGGGGDYYYGQPRVEYRYHAPYGYYGSYGYGGYAPGYYYDAYGRLVYGNPYGYYGYSYSNGGQWWHHPRPADGHDGNHGDNDHDGGDDRNDRRPPWRNIGAFPRDDERAAPDRDDARPRVRRQQMPATMPTMPSPRREQRATAPVSPRMHSGDGGGSRMGRAVRGAKASSSDDE